MGDVAGDFATAVAAATPKGAHALCGVLLRRLAAGDSPEDSKLPPQVLQNALRACEADAASAASAQRPVVQGIALMARAAVLLLVDTLDSIQHAEQSLVQASTLLHLEAPAWMRRDAFLLLGDLMVRVVGQVNEAQRDAFIDRGLAVARAAEYLAEEPGPPRARAIAIQALLLAERFGAVRDRHLMDALERATHALTLLGEADVRGVVRWGVLHLEMGNAALHIASSRATWVREARRFYVLGRGIVDADRYPRLAAVFDRNLALWADGGGEALEAELPPNEQQARARRVALAAPASRA